MLLAVAFGYLAIQAIRNIGLFGLAAGFVLTWNLREWVFELATEIPATRSPAALGLAARVALAVLISLVIMTVVTGGFFRATAELRHFGLREEPLAYAHEAAQFAGRQGLPDRALVFDLRQAGVYLFHNGPTRKLFMDGRLEVPDRSTFDTYVRLDQQLIQGRPGWAEPVRPDGQSPHPPRPPRALERRGHASGRSRVALHLLRRGWLRLRLSAPARFRVVVSERRFRSSALPLSSPQSSGRAASAWALGEAKGLYSAGWALPNKFGSTWPLRFSFMLLASDRLREAIATNATVGGEWLLLGSAYWSMVPDLTVQSSGPEEPWDPAISLLSAKPHSAIAAPWSSIPGIPRH